MKRLTAPQIIVLSFLAVILIGACLLSFPKATARGEALSPIDALFTATSATCVTGLTVKNTAIDFSLLGKIIILLLIQAGGLGIMTLSTMFAILLGKRLTLKENVVIQSTLDHHKVEGVAELIKYIFIFTFGIELIGAGLLYIRWSISGEYAPLERLFNSVFHAISAFCNAGFSTFSNNLMQYRSDTYTNLVIIALIIAGGMGFIVLLDIRKVFFSHRKYTVFPFKRLSLQSKLTLTVSFILILLGTAVIFLLEGNSALKGMPLREKLLGSLFQSVTPRTAGFNTLAIADFRATTLVFIVLLMFIGASPGSTGGGIKTSTFSIMLAAAWAMMHNRESITIFKRTIPRSIFNRAFMIFFLSVILVFSFTWLLSIAEKAHAQDVNYYVSILFETTSAFGTVGLSTGITPTLSALGKLLVIITMFVGRIGALTLALAVALQKEKLSLKYPEERVMVG